MAACALGFNAEEGGGDDGGLCGEWDVVLRCDAEACGAAVFGTAAEVEEFGDHEVERFVIEEGFMNPPAEGASVIQRGVEDVWVFGQHVLPVPDAVIGSAGICEKAVDEVGALLRVFVGDERVDFGLGRDDSEGVEGHSAQEGEIVGEGCEGGGEGAELRPDGAFVDPLFE